MDESSVIVLPPEPGMEVAPQGHIQPLTLALTKDERESIKESAAELGLSSINAKSLMAMHSIGAAIKRAGAIKVGRAILISAYEDANLGITHCNDILNEEGCDPAIKRDAVKIKREFVSAKIEVGTNIIKSSELDGDDDGAPKAAKAFNKGAIIFSQQTDVHAGEDKPKKSKKSSSQTAA